jgi:hypothetical protein
VTLTHWVTRGTGTPEDDLVRVLLSTFVFKWTEIDAWWKWKSPLVEYGR